MPFGEAPSLCSCWCHHSHVASTGLCRTKTYWCVVSTSAISLHISFSVHVLLRQKPGTCVVCIIHKSYESSISRMSEYTLGVMRDHLGRWTCSHQALQALPTSHCMRTMVAILTLLTTPKAYCFKVIREALEKTCKMSASWCGVVNGVPEQGTQQPFGGFQFFPKSRNFHWGLTRNYSRLVTRGRNSARIDTLGSSDLKVQSGNHM